MNALSLQKRRGVAPTRLDVDILVNALRRAHPAPGHSSVRVGVGETFGTYQLQSWSEPEALSRFPLG
jgi:hypothetical protein